MNVRSDCLYSRNSFGSCFHISQFTSPAMRRSGLCKSQCSVVSHEELGLSQGDYRDEEEDGNQGSNEF